MTPAPLPELQPGELLVRVLRGELTIPPDFAAIARANWKLRNWALTAARVPLRNTP